MLFIYVGGPISVKKELVKELLKILDGRKLDGLSKKEVDELALSLSGAVSRSVPVKVRPELKIVRIG